MNGLLKTNPLIEIIWEIKSSSMGGALRLVHDKYKCVIYFAEGDVLFTTSNVKAYRLRDCLIRWNILSEDALAQIEDQVGDSELFNQLLERGLLTPEDLEQALAKQAEAVLKPALLWTEGDWAYDPTIRLENIAGVRFDSINLLLQAVRRLPPEFAAGRLSDSNEVLTPAMDLAVVPDLSPTEAFLLSRLDIPMKVSDLMSISGLPDNETLHVAYCLIFAGMIQRSGFRNVFSDDIVKASKSSSPDKARMISMSFLTGATKMPSAAPVANVAPPEAAPDTSLRDLEILMARLEGNPTFYEILDVGRAVDDAEIKRVYYSLARKFHPDHFRHHSDPQLHGRVEATFAKIARAYETLRTPNLRKAYDARIGFKPLTQSPGSGSQNGQTPPGRNESSPSKSAKMGDAPSASAEESFKRGMDAMAQENFAFAAAAFSEAIKLAPKEARFRAWYGRALGARQQTRRQAEAEIQSAIAMDKQNPLFYVMLAELYRNLSLFKRAQSALEQALAIDPRHREARDLMNRISQQQSQRD